MSAHAREPGAFPERPMFTPVFVCALFFWALCAIGYDVLRGQGLEGGSSLVLAGSLGCVPCGLLCLSKKTRVIGLALVAACVGFCLGVSQGIEVHRLAEAVQGYDGSMVIELLEDSSNNGYGESAQVRARFPDKTTAVLEARFSGDSPLLAGQRYSCTGTCSSCDYDRRPNAWNDGSCGIVKVSSGERLPAGNLFDLIELLRERALDAIGCETDSQRLLQALVCGYRHDIRDTDLYACFQTCGLAHLVAVSGAHLVIVTGAFAELLRLLRAPRWLLICALVALMGSYYIVAGMPVSALRAAIMCTLGLASFFGKRRASSLNAVGVGIFGIIVSYPPSCLSASFALSSLSTAGIVLFAPLFQAWFGRVLSGKVSFVAEALSLTLSAGLLSQLFAASLFSQIPVVAPLSNMLATPLFPLVCGGGLVAALVGVVAAPLALPFRTLAEGLSSLMSGIVHVLASMPYAMVPVSISAPLALALSFTAALLLWIVWPRRARALAGVFALAVGLAIGFTLPLGAGDCIVMLDVGQGDAILVKSKGRALLIDTGNQDGRLLEQLGRNGVAHLDAVLVTHADDDHCGSLDALRKAVVVDCVFLASGIEDSYDEAAQGLVSAARDLAQSTQGLKAGDSFSLGAFTAHVIWPDSVVDNGGNADSLVLLMDYDGNDDGLVDYTALMTGDAETDELNEMIRAGRVGHVDILKVGHHGSKNGSTLEQMEVLSPDVALISCGKYNRYGHPASQTLDQLDQVGANTFRTDREGMITCALTSNSLNVSWTK